MQPDCPTVKSHNGAIQSEPTNETSVVLVDDSSESDITRQREKRLLLFTWNGRFDIEKLQY